MLVLGDDAYEVAFYGVVGSQRLEYVDESEGKQLAAGLAEAVRERGHGDGESHHAVILVYHHADHVLVDEGHVLGDVHLNLLVGQAGELVQDGVGVVEHGEYLFGPALDVLGLAGYNNGHTVFFAYDLVVGNEFLGHGLGYQQPALYPVHFLAES